MVSLVGMLMGSPATFDQVQWKGAENVALVAREQNAKLVHLSAIGADPNSPLPSPRTKALGEQAVLVACPNATILRPSLVFGPGDSFFMVKYYHCIEVYELSEVERFATLSRFLPFMPVFGGGHSKFQPVYVGDLARAIEVSARDDPEIESLTRGKIIEAGGPDSGYTAREASAVLMAPHSRHVQANHGACTQVYESLPAYRIRAIRCWPTASSSSRAIAGKRFLPVARAGQFKVTSGVPSDPRVGGAACEG